MTYILYSLSFIVIAALVALIIWMIIKILRIW